MKPYVAILGLFSGAIVAGCLDLQTNNENTGGATGSSSASASSSGAGGGSLVAIQEWTATEPVGDEYTLPDWLKIECATLNRTSQWSESTLKGPYGANAARPRNVGQGWGLSVESKRRNQIKNSNNWNGANWNGPVQVTEMNRDINQADPAGDMNAARFNSKGNDRSVTTDVPQGYASVWLRSSNTPPQVNVVLDNGGTSWTFRTPNLISTWQRYSIGVGDGKFFLDTVGNSFAQAPNIMNGSVIYAFAAQHENDGNGGAVKYASSYIPNADIDRTREADRLYSNNTLDLMPQGYFHVILTFAPNYASNEASSAVHSLLYVNDGNLLRLDLKNGRVTWESSGNSVTGPASGGISWDREQAITIEAKSTPAGRSLTLSGATTGNFQTFVPGDRPWPTDSPLHILGDNGGAHECADLRYIGFFVPN